MFLGPDGANCGFYRLKTCQLSAAAHSRISQFDQAGWLVTLNANPEFLARRKILSMPGIRLVLNEVFVYSSAL